MTALTRRQFLRSSAVTVAAACGSATGWGTTNGVEGASEKPGVLVDLTRCIGCRACMRACSVRNALPESSLLTVSIGDRKDLPRDLEPEEIPAFRLGAQGGSPSAMAERARGVAVESLRFDRWTVVNAEGPEDASLFVKRQCMHCVDPACVSVCPVAALQQLPSGAVVYRQDRCIGCRYCMFACPFGVPTFEWGAAMTPVIGKCQWCAQGPVNPGPACVAACPTGALKSRTRGELLFEAKARIHSHPEIYVDHVYGEHEAGGTAWMYLSSVPFTTLNFPKNLPNHSLPSLTRVALHILPFVVAVLAVVLSVVSRVARPAGETHGAEQ